MKKGLVMTLAQVEEHQRRHGFTSTIIDDGNGAPFVIEHGAHPIPKPKPRMNKTETEYSLILEARKRRGEIVEWKFEGISLSWGKDPETGKPMWYTEDFVVWPVGEPLELHEVKGGHIFPKDLIRFKGCRAEWGMHFRFVMIQKKEGQWTRIH